MSHLPKVRSAPLVLGRVAVPVNQIGGEAPHKYGDTGQPIPPGLCDGPERLRRHQSENSAGIDRCLQNLGDDPKKYFHAPPYASAAISGQHGMERS